MKAIMVMYDSLRRDLLESYGCDWTKTPNFKRLADLSVQFENCYVGSMPCMPARRELHTGRINFFHRSWGPMEPFDDSMPEILKKGGVYTHLVSDHQHYWEDGGCTYHNRYSSWEISRGQEGDLWKADLSYRYDRGTVFKNKEVMLSYPPYRRMMAQDAVNRSYMDTEEKTSQAVTFHQGLEFIEKNHGEDNWFLQIETFDPHEPFYSLKEDKALYPHTFLGDAAEEADWPPYAAVAEDENTVQHVRYEYAALLSKCDRYLGKVLDMMDQYHLWDDTMLIVNTDHGFMLSQHNWWGKMMMPYYNELAHTPLFVWDPRTGVCGERRQALVQTIDLAPTLLEYFGLPIPADMEGRPLRETIESDKKIRDYALFGQHGIHVNITDGRYVYMRCPMPDKEQELFNYVVEPTSYPGAITVEELKTAVLHGGFSFTKGCPMLRIKGGYGIRTLGFPPRSLMEYGTLLYDTETDPGQEHPLEDKATEERMIRNMVRMMKENDAPDEQYVRLGLEQWV